MPYFLQCQASGPVMDEDIIEEEPTKHATEAIKEPLELEKLSPATADGANTPLTTGEANLEEVEDDEDESAGYEESAERDEIIRERINRTQEQMKAIVDGMSEEQQRRYEKFRRVYLSRPVMERFMQRVLDQKVNANCVIVATGIAKVFVGELIEGARQVMEDELRGQLEESQPQLSAEAIEDTLIRETTNRLLEPFHILESHRRMQEDEFTAPRSYRFRKPSPF